ncbi:atrial natriuretic peptide-converting enzyme-like [Bacillus rossius redtenbacheri]|uniref:atrial natriuretic peptide-converting enzyme-like n=1 Tax=Bacillus rossius redtenbacheri TaxID=93214 RepID=UPI002FDE19C1
MPEIAQRHNVGVNFDSLTHIPNQKVIADTQEPALQKHSQSVTPRNSQTCHETQKYSDSHANTAIPSPLPQQSENNTIKSTIRHDSNVSSDSFSPNSSPSYTNKTMETPLLKHHEVGKKSTNSRCDKVAKYSVTGASKDALLDKIVYEGCGKDELCNTSLTKSISTPASLQAIVRFRHGSNMSLHHRIIRDMRRPSTHYPTRKRLLFRFGQVFLNAVALIAIAGGLAAYFRAYPSPVHYVNKTITSVEIARGSSDDMNPAPGLCLPVIVSFCHYHRVSYNYTMFPNYIGHFTQRDAQQEFEMFNAIVEVRCYELAALFLCSVFVPKCGSTGRSVTPCSKLCFETKRRCGFFLDLFGLTLPDYLDCSMFPESPNPNVCIGYQEVVNEEIRALKPVCTAGFQCDNRRCIPQDWRCDGHIDCEDQTDELNCFTCAKGLIHCGGRRCISQTHMCDGVVDCPWGQDERNCIRLSERMGDIGYGQLHVFHAERQMWQPACLKTWDNGTSAQTLCSILGYTRASSNTLTRRGDNSMLLHNNNTRYEWKSYRQNPRRLLKNLKNCNGSYLTVEVSCTNYVCGRQRRMSAPRPSLRVVGGTEASPGDWPFLVAILGGPEEVFYCAGVLIADQWVLTASHCVGNISDPSGWTIQLGITRRHSHAYFGQKMKVRRVVPHPMYNLGVAHDNDVALFQLKSRVSFHDHLLPVCLPSPHYELAPGTMCTVIGWGKREDSETTEYEPAVNEVQVPVLNRELCNIWLQQRNLNVTEGMICAGYAEGGKDACQGDSGGPLLCRDDAGFDRWFVGGIVSWGIKCAHPHLPGVYTYVPRYVPWIIRKMSLYSN